jgi:glycosyltransferase involved in cell wall biosynthesis
MKTIIVMPCYNAEKTIEKVFKRIPKNCLRKITKFIIVNDGSKDKTKFIVLNLKKRYKITLVNHKQNLGYGATQKTGFKHALYENAGIIALLHADGQYPPEKINKLVEPILKKKADVVGGSRHLGGDMLKQGMPFYKFLGNVLSTKLLNLVTGKKLSCYHSGFKAYSRKALEKIDFVSYSNNFCFDTEMLIGAIENNLRIEEIPIPTFYGKEISHLNPARYGIGILEIILKHILFKLNILRLKNHTT